MKVYDYTDYKFNWFMDALKPEIRKAFEVLLKKEGPSAGRYTIDQIVAELIFHIGEDETLKLLEQPTKGGY